MQSQYRALHYSASRGKNVKKSLTLDVKRGTRKDQDYVRMLIGIGETT